MKANKVRIPGLKNNKVYINKNLKRKEKLGKTHSLFRFFLFVSFEIISSVPLWSRSQQWPYRIFGSYKKRSRV